MRCVTSRGMSAVEADVDDPGQHEGDPAESQQFVAESSILSQLSSVAELVHQDEAVAGVQADQGDHREAHQQDEEETEVETLSHQSGLVQLLLPPVHQQSLVVVVVVGEDTG